LDGDADRIVFYFVSPKDNTFQLLDGDRIATLAASFLADLGRQSGLADRLAIGVVQTAYANGAATKYVTNVLKLPVVCTPTGVKHLHHAATRFDIGVYFEANGHQDTALKTLKALLDLINQTVGDALSDLLLVEVILAHKGWTVKEWLGTYVDLPNRLVKVEVADRNIFKAVDAERKLDEPKGIQQQIEELVLKYKDGRSFARASGTEDAVRVYAEAATRGEADQLATRVAELVKRFGS
jgi:phosphoacetylglucosamine mutase